MNHHVYETPPVSDSVDALGAGGGVVDGLRLYLGNREGASGPARTATVVDTTDPNIPGLAEFLDDSHAGDVIVLGWQAQASASAVGGLAATRLAAIGCVGIVTNGFIRDIDEIRDAGLTVWAAGSTPRSGKGRLGVTKVGEPAQLGSLIVNDRDFVVADATGVCVVAQSDIDAVLASARDLQEREIVFRDAMLNGMGFAAAKALAKTM